MSHGPLSDLFHITWRRADRTWFRVAGALITLLVFSAGFLGLLWTEGKHLGPVGCLYATFELFLFAGNPASLSSQHSRAAVALISIAAFGGPILTAAFVALMIRQLAAVIRDRQSVRVSGHVVIFGTDREGVHWGNYLHRTLKLPIVFVNLADEGPHLGRARKIGKALLVGDMRDERTRRRAAVSRSKLVVVCTGDELANIDTARAIERETRPLGPRIYCRVVSQSLLFRMRSSGRAPSSIRFFNIYNFVAQHAIQATLESASANTVAKEPGKVHLIISGFGRFGQAVLHAAGANAALVSRLSDTIDIVDLRADELLDEYRFSAPRTDEPILAKAVPHRSRILSQQLWDLLLLESAGALRVIFICTDNDVTNLVHALAIKRLVDKRKSEDIRAILVMRQYERPQNIEGGLLYATMGESTDEQIARLIGEP